VIQPAIICDVDGTIAIRGERSPYDMTRVGEDTVNHIVAMVVKMFHMCDMKVIFTSGRDETARHDTMEFLERALMAPDFQLLMRETGDQRPDEIVKQEMLERIRAFYNIILVLDDRQRVVDMWRANGLTCFQVNPGPETKSA
jgi:hypothetical protein